MTTYHKSVINLGAALGYLAKNAGGVCHGVALTWLTACMIHDEEKFNNRLAKIVEEGDLLPDKINKVREKVKNNKKLTTDDRELLEILSFYEHITLSQLPDEYKDFYNTSLSQKDIDKISQFALSDKIHAEGGLKTVHSQFGAYTQKEIELYLNSIADSIDSVHYPSEDQAIIGIHLASSSHSIALSYDATHRRWCLMDINHWPPRFFERDKSELLSKYIQDSFCKTVFLEHNEVAFTSAIVTTANDTKRAQLEENLKCVTAEPKLTKEMAQSVIIDLIHLAIKMGRTDIIIELSKHSDINLKDEKGRTPCMAAAECGDLNALSVFANIDKSYLNAADIIGKAPVHYAAQLGQVNIIKFLAEKDPSCINLTDNRGASPAHYASWEGQADVIKELAKYTVNFNLPNENGDTPAHFAASYGHEKVITELSKHDVRFDTKNKFGSTPAILAARDGHLKVLVELKRLKVPLDMPGDNNITPLFFAVWYGRVDAVRYLLQPPNIKKTAVISATTLIGDYANGEDEKNKVKELIKLSSADAEKIPVTAEQIAYILGQDEVILELRSKADQEIVRLLDKLIQKQKKLAARNQVKTAKTVEELHQKLSSSLLNYYSGEPTQQKYAEFSNACSLAINDAKPKLEKHRKLKDFLAIILTAVVSLGLINLGVAAANKYKTGRWSPHMFRTDSVKLAEDTELVVNQMKPKKGS